jgi:hypothetical protein
MSESRRQAVMICHGLFWLLLLSGSVFVLRKPTDAQLTKESRDSTQWSRISSLFGGVFNAEQGKTNDFFYAEKTKEPDDDDKSHGRIENSKDETHIVKPESQKFEKDKKVEDSVGGVVSEEVSADTYSEKSPILQHKKTQALEQRRQGIECVNCVYDGEGNVLPSSLERKLTFAQVSADESRHSQSARDPREDRAPGGGTCVRRCEYPGENLYEKRGRRTESSHEVSDKIINRSLTWSDEFLQGMETSGGAVDVDETNPVNAQPIYVTVNGITVLPSDHARCKNVKFICPGEKPNGRLWKCPLKKNPGSGGMRAPGDSGNRGVRAPSSSEKESYYGYNYNSHSKGGSKGIGDRLRGGSRSKGKIGSKGSKSMNRELTWSESFLAMKSNESKFNVGQGNPMNAQPNKTSYAYLPSEHPQCTMAAFPPAPQMDPTHQVTTSEAPTPEAPAPETPLPEIPTEGVLTTGAPTPGAPTPEAPTPGAQMPETLIPEAPSSPMVLTVESPVMPPTQMP